VISDREEVRMLRDDFGMTDNEIAAELGCELVDVIVATKPVPADLLQPDLMAADPDDAVKVPAKVHGGPLRRPLSDESEARLRLQIASVEETVRLERELATDPRNTKKAPAARPLGMSRGAKLLRLAQAMALLRGCAWWEQPVEKKRQFVTLAGFALDALELVELDEDALKKRRKEFDL
jgi:hypothetical protein